MKNKCFFFFQAEDGIRDIGVTGVQTCALPISMYRKQLLSQAVYDKEDIMSQVSQAPIRLRNGGMLILTLLLVLQGLLGIAAIVQTVFSASTSGIDFASLFCDSTFLTGFLTIVIAAVISVGLGLCFRLV